MNYRLYTFISRLKDYWVRSLDTLRKITMLVTFLGIVFGTYSSLYFFICKARVDLLLDCIFLVTMVFVNKKLQD